LIQAVCVFINDFFRLRALFFTSLLRRTTSPGVLSRIPLPIFSLALPEGKKKTLDNGQDNGEEMVVDNRYDGLVERAARQ
jgi:hypothetical protein